MMLALLVCNLLLAFAVGQQADDEWVDPYDMINYDSTSQTMKKPRMPAHYDNVATKRREHTEDSSQADLAKFSSQVADLQKKIEEQKEKISLLSQEQACNPVFKRFLRRLMKEMQRLGLPTDSSDASYDANIVVSKQAISEIQRLLDGEDNWRHGALDIAISQLLVNMRPHDLEAWKWHFEDTFGVELDTLLKIGLCVLVMMAIICTQLWSTVSWFMQFRRLFAVCFFVSIVWNWFYLYKLAFAEHKNNMVKMDDAYEKCTGLKKLDWSDSLKEWYRSTWTLQDDNCKKYYEGIMINPILLVPPTKAISMTVTTFVTEPLKHIGQGISEFLRALLKDLPVTLQIPVLLAIVLVILVFVYVSVQASFLHGITAPLRPRGPPPPGLQQPPPQAQIQGIADADRLIGDNAEQQGPRRQPDKGRANRERVHRRHTDRPREERTRVFVETLQSAARSEDETDTEQQEGRPEAEHTEESEAENKVEEKEEPEKVDAKTVSVHRGKEKTKTTSKAKPVRGSENRAQEKPSRDDAAQRSQPKEQLLSHTDVKDPMASVTYVETLGIPVQETCTVPEE